MADSGSLEDLGTLLRDAALAWDDYAKALLLVHGAFAALDEKVHADAAAAPGALVNLIPDLQKDKGVCWKEAQRNLPSGTRIIFL
jgi:hypothetical protein